MSVVLNCGGYWVLGAGCWVPGSGLWTGKRTGFKFMISI